MRLPLLTGMLAVRVTVVCELVSRIRPLLMPLAVSVGRATLNTRSGTTVAPYLESPSVTQNEHVTVMGSAVGVGGAVYWIVASFAVSAKVNEAGEGSVPTD